MDSLNDPNASSGKATSRLIDKLHSMPWLKHGSSPQEGNFQQARKSKEVFSTKKTDEDYFCGTREQRKEKKVKKKKEKSNVLTISDLEDLLQKTNEKVTSDLSQASEPQENKSKEKKLIFGPPLNPTNDFNATSNTVWSKETSVADKLFPNVQSLRIDRTEEEEMFSRALAESIATVQLEKFKRSSPEKENRWEILYGSENDDDGWDDVYRNLPSSLKKTTSANGNSGQKTRCDNNNNASKPGILRKKGNDADTSLSASEDLDFSFKTCFNNSSEQKKIVQPSKSVAFNETVAEKFICDESNEANENSKGPLKESENKVPCIDKFGRVDGYSERRLFMGKGARMKEQLYIQNKLSLHSEIGYQTSVSNKQISKDVQIVKSIEKPIISKSTIIRKDVQETSAVPSAEPLINKNIQDSIKKVKSSSLKLKHDASKSMETISQSKVRMMKETKNTEREFSTNSNSISNSLDKKTDEREMSKRKIDSVSPGGETMNSGNLQNEFKVTSNFDESISVPSRKDIRVNTFNVQDLQKSFTIENSNQDHNAPESQISDNKSDSENRCLVPTWIREETYESNIPSLNQRYMNSTTAPSTVGLQSLAYQNSVLTRMLHMNKNSVSQNTCAENFQEQNYLAQQQMQSIEFLKHGNQVAQNMTNNQSPNSNIHSMCNYPNVPIDLQIQNAENAYFLHCHGPQYRQEQRDTHQVNLYSDVSNRMNCKETGNSSSNIEKLSETNRVSVARQHVPGFVKNSEIPPGFRSKVSARRNENNNNQVIDSTTATRGVTNNKSVENNGLNNELASGSNGQKTLESFGEIKNTPSHKRSINFSPSVDQQTYYRSRDDLQHNQSESPEGRKIPYPILGAWKNSYENCKEVNLENKGEVLNSSQCEIGENPIRSISNNNYSNLNSSNVFLNSCSQDVNNSLQNTGTNLQSTMPNTFHYINPNQSPPGLSYVSNWQYNANIMNVMQLPINVFQKYHTTSYPNSFETPGSLETSMHLNSEFHPVSSNTLSQLQMSTYCRPHLPQTKDYRVQDLPNEDLASLNPNNIQNRKSYLEMLRDSQQRAQQPIPATQNTTDYNLNENLINQFVPNVFGYSNSHGNQKPCTQKPRNSQNNQCNEPINKLFDNVKVGRGRGRLTKKDLL